MVPVPCFGATAQMRYTEPVATLDADVPDHTRILALLESGNIGPDVIAAPAARRGLSDASVRLARKCLDA